MSLVKSVLKSILYLVTGNYLAQRLLQKNYSMSQYFMGIGSGGQTSGSGESKIIKHLISNYPPPFCIFDVGANKGQFLNIILKCMSTNKYTIHCFEPGVTAYNVLSKNKGNDDRIILNNLGLGREHRKMILYYEYSGSGLASLTKRNLDHFDIDFNKSEDVQIDTLDNYCLMNSIDKINLLKIDVEGHELDVLYGAKDMLKMQAIDIVTFEFGGCNIDTRSYFQDFWYFFLEVDMKIFRITPSGFLFPIDSYKEIDEQFRTTNFMAIRNGQ